MLSFKTQMFEKGSPDPFRPIALHTNHCDGFLLPYVELTLYRMLLLTDELKYFSKLMPSPAYQYSA